MSSPAEFNIDAGELRQQVTIQQIAITRDEFGGEVKAWADFVTLRAKIEPLSGRELTEAAQIYPESNTRITIRYYPGIDPSMRVLDETGAQYDITNLSDVEYRHVKLLITAIQRPAGRDA